MAPRHLRSDLTARRICHQQPPRCLYRHAAADLIDAGDLTAAWRAASDADGAARPRTSRTTWELCERAGTALAESPADGWPADKAAAAAGAVRRASLCFGQQMLVRQLANAPRFAEFWTEALLREADRE